MMARSISRYTLENIAHNVLNKYSPDCLAEARPTPVEEIMEISMGLNIEYHDLSLDKTVLGCVSMQDSLIRVYDNFNFYGNDIGVDRGTVVISNHLLNPQSHGRRKYTCAYELGHWELHKNSGIVLTRCNSSIGGLYKPKTDAEWLEWQADCFAAALLMPPSTFKQAFQMISGQTVFSVEGYVIPYIAQLFEVSKQAATIRARHLFLM